MLLSGMGLRREERVESPARERQETGVEAEDVSDRLSIGGVCNYPSETERQAEQRQAVRVSSVDGVR